MEKDVPSQFKKIKNEALKFEDGKIYVENDNFLLVLKGEAGKEVEFYDAMSILF